MKRKIGVSIFMVLLVIVGLASVKTGQIQKMIAGAKARVAPAESVSSFIVREETWPDMLEAIGSISAVQGVTVAPEVAGAVSEIDFESGSMVNKGDVLVRLDTSSEEAQLKAAEAQLEWARVSAERARALRTDSTVSQSELDQAEAAWKQAKANVDAIHAAIAKKTIRAPFSGRLGIRQVNLGQYLEAGKPIVSLQSLSPVYANFSLPQQHLASLKTGMRVLVSMDAYSNHVFEGVLTAMNPDLDSSTRSVMLQASLENTNLLLRPGMFARIQVVLPSEQRVLVIPATSILSAPYGDSVFVIESQPATNNTPAGLVVRQQFVRTGRARGDFLSVQTGLKPGDRIASSGIFKLRNGMTVAENNDVVPTTSESPRPENK